MTKKKTRKPKPVKYTDGVLCRDTGASADIAFCPGGTKKTVTLSQWLWCGKGKEGWQSWTLAQWENTYDLTPPRPGRCFECQVEL